MKCECVGPHMPGHRHSNALVPVDRDGRLMNVCTECVLSKDKRVDTERQAWATVEMAADDALEALRSVNFSPLDQATLMFLVEKAQVQQKLWAVEVRDGVLVGEHVV